MVSSVKQEYRSALVPALPHKSPDCQQGQGMNLLVHCFIPAFLPQLQLSGMVVLNTTHPATAKTLILKDTQCSWLINVRASHGAHYAIANANSYQ